MRQVCGWDAKFPLRQRQQCVYYGDGAVTWQKKGRVHYKGKLWTDKYMPHTGTWRELMDSIAAHLQYFKYHRWLNRWLKHQFNLDVATFDPVREILLVTDFAAQFPMAGSTVGTCEHSPNASQLVALVLYNPAPEADGGGIQREVQCDYWRTWIDAKGDAPAHHLAMKQILGYYRDGQGAVGGQPVVPGLQRIKVYSDGERGPYKGRKNFGRMVHWPRSARHGGKQCELWHTCHESHHGSGAVDNAGKAARRKIDAAVIARRRGARSIYTHAECYRWCKKYYAQPGPGKLQDGTWTCNGKHHWRLFNSPKFPHHHLFQCATRESNCKDFDGVDGSNGHFCFRANMQDHTQTELEVRFIPCFCPNCQLNHRAYFNPTNNPTRKCWYFKYTQAPKWEHPIPRAPRALPERDRDE